MLEGRVEARWSAIILIALTVTLTGGAAPSGGVPRQDTAVSEDEDTEDTTSRQGTGRTPGVAIVEGPDAITRSVQMALQAFPGGAASVYLARADVIADALAAGPVDGPVLLVPRCGTVPSVTVDALTQLAADRVVALGGVDAICEDLLTAAADGIPTDRLAGPTRIETAVAIATATAPTGSDLVYVASAADSPDAVAVGTADDGPVLLVPPTGVIPGVVSDTITRLQARLVIVVGGTAAVEPDVVAQLDRQVLTVRLAGANRFETAGIISGATFGPGSRTERSGSVVHLVDGASLADAVAAAASPDGPVLLTGGCAQPLPAGTATQLSRLQPGTIVVVDPVLVCDGLVDAAVTAATTPPAVPADDHDAAVALPQVVLPGIGTPCAAPPTSSLLPPEAVCVQTVALDLDGQGDAPATLDRVITYHDTGSGDQMVIAVTSTARVAERVTLPAGDGAQLPAPDSGAARSDIACITDVTGDGLAEVITGIGRSADGVRTDVAVTTHRGGLGVVARAGAQGAPFDLVSGPMDGAAGDGWRVVPGGGGIVTTSYDTAAPPGASWTRWAAVGSELVTTAGLIEVPRVAGEGFERWFAGGGCRAPQPDPRLRIGPGSVGQVPMGSGYTPARAAFDEVLGDPVQAGDWAEGFCAPEERVLTYGNGLTLIFDRDEGGGDGALNYVAADHPLVVQTDGGATVGTTVSELFDRHPGLELTIQGGLPRAVLDPGAAYPRLVQLTGIGTRDVVTLTYQTIAAGC